VYWQVVVVLDPDLSKEYLDRVQNRSKEKKYAFDVAFGPESTNEVLLLRCATFVIHIVGTNIAVHAQELTYIINCLIRMFTMPQ
jgi:kinesin family protein 18/19